MPLPVRVQRIAEDRRPLVGKTIGDAQRQRKGLREISNVPSHVTQKVADLKISTGVRQKPVEPVKITKIVSSSIVNKITAENKRVTKFAPSSSVPKVSQPKPQEDVKKTDSESTSRKAIEDIDKIYGGNVFLVSEYAKDVYSYLMGLEIKFKIERWPLPSSKITEGMRTILVDWLVDVHMEFSLLQETIHGAVAILDRFLQSDNNIEKDIFQLVGICSLSLACKYEEIFSPCLDEFTYLCKNAFTKKELLEMEKKMLSALNYDLGRPVSVVFLRRYNMAARADKLQHCYSKYFIDSVMLDSSFCHLRPSLVAAAAAFIAICIINKTYDSSLWTPTMEFYSLYSFSAVKPVAIQMALSIIKGYKSKYDSVRRKYAQSSFLGVSMKTQASIGILETIARSSDP